MHSRMDSKHQCLRPCSSREGFLQDSGMPGLPLVASHHPQRGPAALPAHSLLQLRTFFCLSPTGPATWSPQTCPPAGTSQEHLRQCPNQQPVSGEAERHLSGVCSLLEESGQAFFISLSTRGCQPPRAVHPFVPPRMPTQLGDSC